MAAGVGRWRGAVAGALPGGSCISRVPVYSSVASTQSGWGQDSQDHQSNQAPASSKADGLSRLQQRTPQRRAQRCWGCQAAAGGRRRRHAAGAGGGRRQRPPHRSRRRAALLAFNIQAVSACPSHPHAAWCWRRRRGCVLQRMGWGRGEGTFMRVLHDPCLRASSPEHTMCRRTFGSLQAACTT